MEQINVPLWVQGKDGKTFIRCYTIQNFELSLMPILLYYTAQVISQQKCDTFVKKCGEKQ